MSQNQILSIDDHLHLKLRSSSFEESVKTKTNCPILLKEIFAAASCYPVMLMKDDLSNSFVLSSIFCLQSDSNNFLVDGAWSAPYVPISVRRQPFSLVEQMVDGASHFSPVINVESDLISKDSGEQLFTKDGQPSAALVEKLKVLNVLKEGQSETERFVKLLLELDLVIPLKVKLEKASKVHWVSGLYGIDINKISEQNHQLISTLTSHGVLEACLMMKASMAQIERLVWMENKNIDCEVESFSIMAD